MPDRHHGQDSRVYASTESRLNTQVSDIAGLPGGVALNIRTGARRLSIDLDEAQADALADGQRVGIMVYQRPAHEVRTYFAVFSPSS